MTTYIGAGIDGFDEALMLMSPGDKMICVVPSHLAYGSEGYAHMIPPNAILKFEIELVSIL